MGESWFNCERCNSIMSDYRNTTYTCSKCQGCYCEDCFGDTYDRNTNEYYISHDNGYDDPEYCIKCQENKKYKNYSCEELIKEINMKFQKKTKKELTNILNGLRYLLI